MKVSGVMVSKSPATSLTCSNSTLAAKTLFLDTSFNLSFKSVSKYFAHGILVTRLSFTIFQPTKYAKIMTDAKKNGLLDNIRFPQLRFHCKYYKKNFAYRRECSEIIGKNLF